MLYTHVRQRPLTAIAVSCASAVIVFEVVQILRGRLYLRVLDYPDGTTLVMVCCLIIWGLAAFRDRTDRQALAFTWVAAVSCVYAYEAVYKWSFHLAPFAGTMPSSELREFVLHSAVAATVLVGFAQHHFSWKRWSWVGLSVFCSLWALWLLIGFPQLDGELVFRQVVPWRHDWDRVYLINRATKAALFLTYLTLFPSLRGCHRTHTPLGRVRSGSAGADAGLERPLSPEQPGTGSP
jgi:hypothetical protein